MCQGVKILDMILFTCFLISVTCSSYSTAAKINKNDVISFPEVEENPKEANKQNRTPVYSPAVCPENELYYPGDQANDWICDCRPAYIYHPPSDLCWPAFRRGPCADGLYLILPSDSVIPVCEKNHCVRDNYVKWNDKCEKLGTEGPCKQIFPSAALGVNATTLVVSCVRLNFDNRFAEVPKPPAESLPCPSGSRRSINGKC